MVAFDIRYPRKFIPDGRIVKKIPSSWNELTEKQLLYICHLIYVESGDIYRFRIAALRYLLGLSWFQTLMIGDFLPDLFPYVAFLEKENTLTDNKITTLKAKNITLHGPMGGFETLMAEEWTEADQAFIDFSASKDTEDLDRMIAILYREAIPDMGPGHPEWKKDLRQPFIEEQVPLRQRIIADISPAHKFAILTWYTGCRREWEEVFYRVFKESKSDVESFGWQETIQKISGGTFGSLRETERTSMYKIMLHMEITVKDDQERKKQEQVNRMRHAN
jgi:hypothetical protein